ncbi:MAG TPA: hypothetical protein VHM24_01340, partial [Gemmatimonadaceae bacterium]|nr:hypothetical protein [Gemmatimonadaceae bacterium]
AAEPLVVGDPFFLRRQVPVVISEWGGFGFPDYGGPQDNAARAAKIAEYKKELRARGFAATFTRRQLMSKTSATD